MASAPQRWARVPPALAWKHPRIPTFWMPVLPQNDEAMQPEALPGYVWLAQRAAVTGQALTELGLVLDIAGAILLYFFGLPQAVIVERENWVEEHYPRVARWCKTSACRSLISGFVCQLIGTMRSGQAGVRVDRR